MNIDLSLSGGEILPGYLYNLEVGSLTWRFMCMKREYLSNVHCKISGLAKDVVEFTLNFETGEVLMFAGFVPFKTFACVSAPEEV